LIGVILLSIYKSSVKKRSLTGRHWHRTCMSVNTGWRRGVVVSGVGLINEVNRHRARLVLGWVTVRGRVNHLGM